MRSFVVVSLVIHLFIFMHITNLYRSSMVTYIQLTLKDISKPPKRSIPRPRHRPKTPERSQDVKRLKVSPRPIHQIKPIRRDPVESDLPESLVEQVSLPNTPNATGVSISGLNIPGLNISDWNPESLIAIDDHLITTSSYLKMIRLKIESHKVYPKMARMGQIEGRVTIFFVISLDGNNKSVKIVKSSKYKILDQAALKAVKDASPYPKPPEHLFRGEVPLKLTIVFELA